MNLDFIKQNTENTDESLMASFKEGSEDAFQILFDRYTAHIINFAYRIIGSQEESEDVAQDVFLRIYKSKERYDEDRPFKPWIFTIASRLISNHIRFKKRHPEESLDWTTEESEGDSKNPDLVDGSAPLPHESLEKQELKNSVQRALEELPENQRTAVLLARFEEMSYEEISEAMDLSAASVKSLLFRARQSLKRSLLPFVSEKEK